MPAKRKTPDVRSLIRNLEREADKGYERPTLDQATEIRRRNIAKANKIPLEERGRYDTQEDRDEAQKRHALKWKRKNSALSREIGPFPLTPLWIDPDKGRKETYALPPDETLGQFDTRSKGPEAPTIVSPKEIQARKLVQVSGIVWKRRLLCKMSLKAFCETYLPAVFTLKWSKDQLICLQKAETVCREGGKFALAMPRGGGKTALCRAATLWSTLYGYKHFVFNIGATEPKSEDTLAFVQTQLSYNPLLHQDFPELCWPVIHLAGTNRTAGGQLFMGEPTHVRLGTDEIIYPCLLLPKEYKDHYYSHDPDSVRYIDAIFSWIPSNGVVLLRASGIGGSIRGEADTHPVTLEQPRPDLVLIDDVQKDSIADSPLMCDKLIRLIDGAVTGLAGPGAHIDALMPCTVTREGDASDTFIDPIKKPEWQGERCQMVNAWPPGVTNFEVSQETEAGKLWNQYAELRRVGYRENGTFEKATDLYSKHRKVMDEGFVVSWEERFDKRTEISPQQHAMNLRLQLGATFLSEYQNIGRKLIETSEILITPKQFQQKVVDCPRFHMLSGHNFVVTHIDVQNEILFYCTFACDQDFNGTFIDYGTWPEVSLPYFTKAQTESWSLITNAFFKAYPQHKDKAIQASSGKIRAPLEAKIYFALQQAVPLLLNRTYQRLDEHRKQFKTMRLGIDTRWGQASEVIKRYIRESGHQNIIPYYGQAMPPTNRQFEEYELREGWLFEHQQNPLVREPKWVMRPNPDGFWYMQADVNRLKDFLFNRLSVPLGSPGCVTLHTAPAEYHELFVNHICSSEYPEPVSARGITKNMWQEREGAAYDNDYLDCAAACMAHAATLGVTIKTSDFEIQPLRRKLSAIRDQKMARRNANPSQPKQLRRA